MLTTLETYLTTQTLIASAVYCQIDKASLFAWNNSGHKMNKKDTITGNFF